MLLKIHTHPDPVLRRRADEVKKIDDDLKKLLDDMVETMTTLEGMGLAAPQVGEGIRAIVVDAKSAGHKDVLKLINPVIVSKGGEMDWEEGCLSVPEFRIVMKRNKKLTVEYADCDGKRRSLEVEGLAAVVIQHEVDHLDGRLIIDFASSVRQELYLKKRKKHSMEGKKKRRGHDL